MTAEQKAVEREKDRNRKKIARNNMNAKEKAAFK
jgi:hypothetical protein